MNIQYMLENNRVKILLFSVLLIFFVLMYRIMFFGTIEVGTYDWGVDMGYTQLLWGMLLALFCLLILIYIFYPQYFLEQIKPFLQRFATFPIVFLVILYLGFQFIAHDPAINLYHITDFPIDKPLHFLAAFIISFTLLSLSPKRSTILLILAVTFLFTLAYEMGEILFIYYLSNQPYQDYLFMEIEDVIPDMLINTSGILLAFLAVNKKINGKWK